MSKWVCALAGLAMMASIGAVAAQPAPPPAPATRAVQGALLVPGKKTIYQRVITRPAGVVLASPNAGAAVVVPRVDPFSIFYVFAREGDFVKVGTAPRAVPIGWIAADKTIDWRQPIVVAFRDRLGSHLERTLLFRDRPSLEGLIARSDLATRLPQLRQEAIAGRSGADGVVAIEPEAYVDIRNPGSFYLFPILGATDIDTAVTGKAKALEVAYLPERPKVRPPQRDPAAFRAGVTIVMDTTKSMSPYIEGTRKALADLGRRLQTSSVGRNVRFGLVGFRQPETANPGVEYGVRTFLPLTEESTIDRFVSAISDMKEARVSTDGFNEDALGGILAGLRADGGGVTLGARFLILVTDAGPRLPDGRVDLAAGAMLPPEIATLAREQKVHVTVVHLKTPEGRDNHAYAEKQYRVVAGNDGNPDYVAVPGGNAAAFSQLIGQIATGIVDATDTAIRGQAVPVPPAEDTRPEANRQRAFRAMQLAYLATSDAAAIPDVVRAHMVDRDLGGSEKMAVDLRLLITKNQLSTLTAVIDKILEAGDRPTDADDRQGFIGQLRSAIGMVSTDPDGLARGDFRNIRDALGEYLADLPYTSPLSGLTIEEWVRMPATKFYEVKEILKSKRSSYEVLHNNPGIWIRLHDNAPPGEMVTTIRLGDLP